MPTRPFSPSQARKPNQLPVVIALQRRRTKFPYDLQGRIHSEIRCHYQTCTPLPSSYFHQGSTAHLETSQSFADRILEWPSWYCSVHRFMSTLYDNILFGGTSVGICRTTSRCVDHTTTLLPTVLLRELHGHNILYPFRICPLLQTSEASTSQ
jgi:hypothetical protein